MPTTKVYTLEGARRALAMLPKDLQKEMRAASKDIASCLLYTSPSPRD